VRYSPLREPVNNKPIKEFKPQPFRVKPKKMVDVIREEAFIIDSVPGNINILICFANVDVLAAPKV